MIDSGNETYPTTTQLEVVTRKTCPYCDTQVDTNRLHLYPCFINHILTGNEDEGMDYGESTLVHFTLSPASEILRQVITTFPCQNGHLEKLL